MMNSKEFRDALRSGKSVYGTMVTSSSPKGFDTMLSLEPDFVFLWLHKGHEEKDTIII